MAALHKNSCAPAVEKMCRSMFTKNPVLYENLSILSLNPSKTLKIKPYCWFKGAVCIPGLQIKMLWIGGLDRPKRDIFQPDDEMQPLPNSTFKGNLCLQITGTRSSGELLPTLQLLFELWIVPKPFFFLFPPPPLPPWRSNRNKAMLIKYKPRPCHCMAFCTLRCSPKPIPG